MFDIFRELFFPAISPLRKNKSVKTEIKVGLRALFDAMEVSVVKVEYNLELDIVNFIEDIIKVIDELKEPNDLVKLWHISFKMAENIYSIIEDVIKAEFEEDSSDEDYIEVDEEDSFDASSSSESEI